MFRGDELHAGQTQSSPFGNVSRMAVVLAVFDERSGKWSIARSRGSLTVN
jgi:hypothetical protein